MNDPLFTRLHIATLATTLIVIVVFTMFPGVDLFIATALTNGQGNFIAAELGWPVQLSALLRRVMETVAIGSIFYMIWLWIRRAERAWRLCWTYLGCSFLIGPGIIVNLVLKEHVGRARPANVVEFGGGSQFTAAFQITDQCQTNCSFTSGEAALAATLAFTIVSLLWGGLSPKGRGWALFCGGAFLLLGAGLRVVLGRHFPSDVLVSSAVSAFVTLALYRLLDIGTARAAFAPKALRSRVQALARWLPWRQ